jgi:hypothetical protein
MTKPEKGKTGSPQPTREDADSREPDEPERRLPKEAEKMDIKTPTEPVEPPASAPGPGFGRGTAPTTNDDGVDVPNEPDHA